MTRRRVLAGALGFSAMGLLAACGGGDDENEDNPTSTAAGAASTSTSSTASAATATSPSSTATTPVEATEVPAEPTATQAEATATDEPADTTWEFTDGRGITVTLPKPPERIVAFSVATGALWDFGIRPIGIFGITRTSDGSIEATVGNADLDSMTSISDTNDNIDIEALLSLKPDVVISTMNTDSDIWGISDDATLALVEKVAPVIAMTAFFEPIDQLIGHFEDLARALGGDPDSADASAMRDEFNAAAAAIEEAVAAKPDLSVIVCAGNNENFFFANTELFPDLIHLESLGVQFIKPEGVEFDGPWGMISWEQVGQYSPDAFLVDSRRGWPPTAFQDQPIWEGMAAVQAGQIDKWTPLIPLSYSGMTVIMTRQADFFANADENIA